MRDGIIVYEFSRAELARPGNLTPELELAEARMYFDRRFSLVSTGYELAETARAKGYERDAAFLFHQTIERAYHCVLLTLTLYSPKEHNIKKLRGTAEGIEPRLIPAWPRLHRYERRPFNVLVGAYVEAQYSPHFFVTPEDLAYAAERVAQLQAIVKQVCEERLNKPLFP